MVSGYLDSIFISFGDKAQIVRANEGSRPVYSKSMYINKGTKVWGTSCSTQTIKRRGQPSLLSSVQTSNPA